MQNATDDTDDDEENINDETGANSDDITYGKLWLNGVNRRTVFWFDHGSKHITVLKANG